MKRTVILTVDDPQADLLEARIYDDAGEILDDDICVYMDQDNDQLTRALERLADAAKLGVMVREKWGWGTHYPQSDPGYHERVTEEAKEAIARVRAAAGLDNE